MISIQDEEFLTALKCPLTGLIFKTPVLHDSCVYEKEMLELYIKHKKQLPNGKVYDIGKYVFSSITVIPLKSFIKTVIEKNPHLADQVFDIAKMNMESFNQPPTKKQQKDVLVDD